MAFGNWLTNAFNRLRGQPTIQRTGGYFGNLSDQSIQEREVSGYNSQLNRYGTLPRNTSAGPVPLPVGLAPLSGGRNPDFQGIHNSGNLDRGQRLGSMYSNERARPAQAYVNAQYQGGPQRLRGGSYGDMQMRKGGAAASDFTPEPRLQANQPTGLWGRIKNWWNGVNPNDRSSYQQANDEKMYMNAMQAYDNQTGDQGNPAYAGGYNIPNEYMGSTGQPAPQASPWGSGFPEGYQAQGMGEEMQPTLPSSPAPQIPQQDRPMGGS
jgi:hypothetical protein